MHHKFWKNKALLKRIAIYAAMSLSVVAIVLSIVFFVLLNYRFDANDGQLEQYGMLQFNSDPAGAKVSVDGKNLSSLTPNKVTLPSGSHTIVMSRDGYKNWTKTVNVKAGVLGWLNYALLVPADLKLEPILEYPAIYQTLAAPNSRHILISSKVDVPEFDLIDISSNTAKTTKLIIPPAAYSDATTIGVVHAFNFDKWDDGGRYVLIKHSYADKNEWLVLDTQDANLTKNITKLFDIEINNISFSGTSGSIFYALGESDIRKIDLSVGTISRPLVNNVISFNTYNSNIVAYVADGIESNQQIVGLYRDGDDSPRVVRTITKTDGSTIKVAADRYFNEYYVAIGNGKNVDIFIGSYPSAAVDDSSLRLLTTVILNDNVDKVSFSPTGEYILIQSGANFSSYDLEYQSLVSSNVVSGDQTASIKWLNDNYIWSSIDGNLVIREFDGANINAINPVISGHDVALTANGRYLYSIGKSATGYQLQRVQMVIAN